MGKGRGRRQNCFSAQCLQNVVLGAWDRGEARKMHAKCVHSARREGKGLAYGATSGTVQRNNFFRTMGVQCCSSLFTGSNAQCALATDAPPSSHRLAICWCVVATSAVSVDVILQPRHSSSHETSHLAFVWVPLGLALKAFTMLCILIFDTCAGAYCASMLTFGTCLMTCYLAYLVDKWTTMTTAYMTTSGPRNLPRINSFTTLNDFAHTPARTQRSMVVC